MLLSFWHWIMSVSNLYSLQAEVAYILWRFYINSERNENVTRVSSNKGKRQLFGRKGISLFSNKSECVRCVCRFYDFVKCHKLYLNTFLCGLKKIQLIRCAACHSVVLILHTISSLSSIVFFPLHCYLAYFIGFTVFSFVSLFSLLSRFPICFSLFVRVPSNCLLAPSCPFFILFIEVLFLPFCLLLSIISLSVFLLLILHLLLLKRSISSKSITIIAIKILWLAFISLNSPCHSPIPTTSEADDISSVLSETQNALSLNSNFTSCTRATMMQIPHYASVWTQLPAFP